MEPIYKITRTEDHRYTVSYGTTTWQGPGVTSILDIIGSKDKTGALVGWAKKQALLKVSEHLRSFIGKSLIVDEAWIDAVRKSAWKRDRELLKEAGDIGTAIHAAIDEHIAGRVPILDDRTGPGFNNFIAWLKTSGIEIIRGDTLVASLEMGYGGALDALGVKDGNTILLDWKTSNAMRDTYPIQAAAYALAYEETYCEKIDRAYVVRFGKETPGDVEPIEVNLELAKKIWRAALELHNINRPAWRQYER